MANEIKVEFIIEKDGMTDEEYENQEEKVFIITEEMIVDLMHSWGFKGDDEYNHMEDSIEILYATRK